jgi:glycosyltransferase involved in cell wall biosynthesis
MRILHVNPTAGLAYGGPVVWVFEASAVMAEQGIKNVLLTADAPDSEAVRMSLMETVGVGPGTMGAFAKCDALPQWIEDHAAEFDLVVFHAIFTHSSWAGHKAALRAGLPYAVFTHGMLDPWFNRQYPLKRLKKQLTWRTGPYPLLKNAKRVIFTNEPEKRLAAESFSPYQVNPAVIRFGTGAPRFDQAAAEMALNEALPELDGRRYFLYLSRIHPKKGADLLVEAYADVVGDDDEWRLVVAGPEEPGFGEEVRRRVKVRGLQDRVLFPGLVRGDLKWGLMSRAEAFVLPSHQENFGLVIAESLAVGRPVFITPQVNIWEQVEKGGGGLVRPDTREGACAMLRDWQAMPPEAQAEMSQRAKRIFADCFEVRNSAADFAAVAKECLL